MDKVKETSVVQECRLVASECQTILHRNNRGAFKDETGRFVRFGVGDPGGSDLLGWKSVTITPEMVGKKIAVFTALECKIPGWKPSGAAQIKHYNEQLNFINAVKDAGGIAGFVTCRDDVLLLLK
jgi:hypothetical protein